MLSKRIIPCLDVRDGRLTKGIKFKGNVDIGDPVEAAREYYEQGADEIVFYDITASSEGRAIMIDVVRRVAETIFIPFSVGGGIRTVEDMRQVILAGAEKVSVNSEAVKNPAHHRRGGEGLRQPVHRPGHGREKSAGQRQDSIGLRNGHPRRQDLRPASTPSGGPRRRSVSARGRSASTPSTPTGPRTATKST